MDDSLEIEKQVWVNSAGKRLSIDRHKGKGGRCGYLMCTEHKGKKRHPKRYRISVPLPMARQFAEAILEALEP